MIGGGNLAKRVNLKRQSAFPILVACLIFVAIGIATGLLNIAWTFMQPTFGVSLDSLGTLLGAAMLGGLVAAFLNGALIGRFSMARVLVAGMAFAGIGVVGYAIAPTWIALLGVAFIASIGKGTMDAGLNNFVSANYGTSQMNWMHACWGIGLTIAPAVVTYFVLDGGGAWQSGYVLMGAVLLLLGGVILFTAGRWSLRGAGAIAAGGALAKAPLSDSLRQPAVQIGLLFFFLYGGIEIGTGQLANTLFVEARGISQEVSSAWISAYWGSFTLGRMLMGLLALRFGDKSLLNLSFALTVVGALLLYVNPHEAASLVGLLAMGFGLAAIFPILISQTAGRVGEAHAANAIGFQVGCAGFGGAVLSGIAGVLAEHVSIESISFTILLGALLSLLIFMRMQRRAKA